MGKVTHLQTMLHSGIGRFECGAKVLGDECVKDGVDARLAVG